MKKITCYILLMTVVFSGMLMCISCSNKNSQEEILSEFGVSRNSAGNSNDPRWRERMLEGAIRDLNLMRENTTPELTRDQIIRSIGRINAWLAQEPILNGWIPDSSAVMWLTFMDHMESVRNQIQICLNLCDPQRHEMTDISISADPFRVLSEKTQISLKSLQELSHAQTEPVPLLMVLNRLLSELFQVTQQIPQILKPHEIHPKTEIFNMLMPYHVIFTRMGLLMGSDATQFRVASENIRKNPQTGMSYAYLMDEYALLEMFLMRDVSLWAQKRAAYQTEHEPLTELDRVTNLFSWTVRNISLKPDVYSTAIKTLQPCGTPQMPAETLITGQGTALDRAWVFILLARQQNICAFLLRVPLVLDQESLGSLHQPVTEKKLPSDVEYLPTELTTPFSVTHGAFRYLAAYLADDNIYLYDPLLGIPVPAASGISLASREKNAVMQIAPATWEQLKKKPELWNDCIRGAGQDYIAGKEQLEKVTAYVEGSPWYLARRMKIFQSRLTGENRVVLTTQPEHLIKTLAEKKVFSRVELWTYPYEIVMMRAFNSTQTFQDEGLLFITFHIPLQGQFALWRGRMEHLRGNLIGEKSATTFYQDARPSSRDLKALSHSDHQLSELDFQVYKQMRLDASYWSGNIAEECGNTISACEYYRKHVLNIPPDRNRWTQAAYLHLGYAYEISAQYDDALEAYHNVSTGTNIFSAKCRMMLLRKAIKTRVLSTNSSQTTH